MYILISIRSSFALNTHPDGHESLQVSHCNLIRRVGISLREEADARERVFRGSGDSGEEFLALSGDVIDVELRVRGVAETVGIALLLGEQ